MKKLAIIATLMIILFSGCSEDNGHRKIKLSSRGSSQSFAQSFTTTIRFEENDRQSIAVLLFKNKTGDDAMEWMQKGISEMFIRSLSQSNSLSVISMDRLAEIEERIIRDSSSVIGVKELSQKIGREANVDAVIFGSYERAQQRLRINVKLMDPINGFVLKEETETGEGIEQIFDMVDALTNRVKDDLQVTLAKSDRPRGITEITTNSLQAWRYYTEGREAKHKFMVDDAHELYLKAIKLDSNFVSAYLELCEVCYSKGAYEKAAKCFSELKRLKEKATPIEKYQIELLEAVQSGDVTEYMETLSKWVQDYPRNLQVHWNLSALYNDWNNPERALEHLSYVVNIDPKYKLAYNLMAYQHAKLGNFEKAVAALNAYMDISADEANPYDSMGDIHFFFGKYDKAEKYFHKALEKNDKFFPSLLRLAALYLEQGDDKKA